MPTHFLSLQAIFTLHSLYSLLSGGLILWLFRRQRDRSLGYWLAGSVVGALVTALTAGHGFISPMLSMSTAAALLFATNLLFACSVLALSDPKTSAWHLLASAWITLVLVVGLEWIRPSLEAQQWPVLVSVLHVTANLWALAVLLRARSQLPPNRFVTPMALIASLSAFIWLMRIPAVTAFPHSLVATDSTLGSALIFGSLVLLAIFRPVVFIGLRIGLERAAREELTEARHNLQSLQRDSRELTGESPAPGVRRQRRSVAEMITTDLDAALAALCKSTDTGKQDVVPVLFQSRTGHEELRQDLARIAAIIQRVRAALPGFQSQPELLDLTALLDRFVKSWNARPATDAVALELSGSRYPVWVRADDTQLTKVLTTIALNAENALRKGDLPSTTDRHITVALRVGMESSEPRVLITFEDNGPGMDADRLRLVFDPFAHDRPEDMGLSLYLSMALLSTLGGRIAVQNGQRPPPSPGFVVNVSLPVAAEHPASPLPAPH